MPEIRSGTVEHAKALQAAMVAAYRWAEAANGGPLPPDREWVITLTVTWDAVNVQTYYDGADQADIDRKLFLDVVNAAYDHGSDDD